MKYELVVSSDMYYCRYTIHINEKEVYVVQHDIAFMGSNYTISHKAFLQSIISACLNPMKQVYLTYKEKNK